MTRSIQIDIPAWETTTVEIPDVCPNELCREKLDDPRDLFAQFRDVALGSLISMDGQLTARSDGSGSSDGAGESSRIVGVGCDHCGELFPVKRPATTKQVLYCGRAVGADIEVRRDGEPFMTGSTARSVAFEVLLDVFKRGSQPEPEESASRAAKAFALDHPQLASVGWELTETEIVLWAKGQKVESC